MPPASNEDCDEGRGMNQVSVTAIAKKHRDDPSWLPASAPQTQEWYKDKANKAGKKNSKIIIMEGFGCSSEWFQHLKDEMLKLAREDVTFNTKSPKSAEYKEAK